MKTSSASFAPARAFMSVLLAVVLALTGVGTPFQPRAAWADDPAQPELSPQGGPGDDSSKGEGAEGEGGVGAAGEGEGPDDAQGAGASSSGGAADPASGTAGDPDASTAPQADDSQEEEPATLSSSIVSQAASGLAGLLRTGQMGNGKASSNGTSGTTVEVTVYFEIGNSPTAGGFSATFVLNSYPEGFGGNPVPVQVTGSDGSYSFKAASGSTELQNKVADGKLTVSDLPSGAYGLEEIEAPGGYSRDHEKRFRVKDDGTVDCYPADNKDGENLGSSRMIANAQIKPSMLMVSSAGKTIKGMMVSVYTDDDGKKSGTRARSELGGKEEFTAGHNVEDTLKLEWGLIGIPPGIYWLSVDAPPNDPTLEMFDDVRFKVDVYGHVEVLQGSAEKNGDNLTIAFGANEVAVSTLDQWGEGVGGAGVVLEKLNGATWESVKTETTDTAKGITLSRLERESRYRIRVTTLPGGYATASHTEQQIEFTMGKYGDAEDVGLFNGNAPDKSDEGHGNFQNVQEGNNLTLRLEPIVGYAQFKAVDGADASKPLAGVRFELHTRDANGMERGMGEGFSYVTGSDGIVNMLTQGGAQSVPAGTYYFKQMGAPLDYVYDSQNPLTTDGFTIGEGNRYTWKDDGTFGDVMPVSDVTVEPLLAEVRLQTTDEGANPLAGATFELRTSDGKAVQTQTTANADAVFKSVDSRGVEHFAKASQNGELVFVNVPAGTYQVVETTPPPGYKLNVKTYDVTVTQNTKSQVVRVKDEGSSTVVNRLTDGFWLNAAAADDPSAQVDDVELGVYESGSAADPLAVWKRDESGNVGVTPKQGHATVSVTADNKIAGLPAGDYELRETGAGKTPSGYVAPPASKATFSIGVDGRIASSVSGALTGDDATGYTFTLKYERARGQVELTNSIADGKPGTVEGSVFSLYKTGAAAGGGDLLIAEGCTIGAAGTWSSLDQASVANPDTGAPLSEGLAVGDYCFVQTAASPDTALDATARHEFKVTESDHYAATNKAVGVSAVSQAFAASIELKNLDAVSGDPLAGAAFELSCTPEGGGTEQTIKLAASQSEKGAYRADSLKKGSYSIRQTGVPTGYEGAFEGTFVLADEHQGKAVQVASNASGDVKVVKTAGTWSDQGVTNARVPGSFTLVVKAKGAAAGSPGAEFAVEIQEGAAWREVGAYAADDAGALLVENLAWGSYRVTQTTPAEGCVLGATPCTKSFAVDASTVPGPVDLGTVENEKTFASVAIVDEGGAALAGSSLSVEGAFAGGSSAPIAWTSQAAAEAIEGQLVVGSEYALFEQGRAGGYLALPAPVKFKLGDDGRVTITQNQTLADGRDAASVSADGRVLSVRSVKIAGGAVLAKTDEAGKPLAGVTFSLFNADNATALRTGLVTDAQGAVSVGGLAEGSYYFQETATLDDRVLDSAKTSFAIGPEQHGTSVKVSKENKAFATSVSLTAADGVDGRLLAGAQFTLFKQDAGGTFRKVGDAVSTDAQGAASFALTERGTYRIRQTAAPEGYRFDANAPFTATFAVENTGAFQGGALAISDKADPALAAKYGLTVENARYKEGSVACERVSGQVKLSKVDASAQPAVPLDGAEFTLYDAATDKPLGTFETGFSYAAPDPGQGAPAGKGELIVAGLAWGSYYLQETAAPAGYQTTEARHGFAIGRTSEGAVETAADLGAVGNELTEFAFAVAERYVEGCSDVDLGAEDPAATRPLAGAKFAAYADADCTQPATAAGGGAAVATSDAAGRVAFSGLAADQTYWVRATAVPAGRVSDGTVYKAQLASDGTLASFERADAPGTAVSQVVYDVLRADIVLKTVAETDAGKPLPGAEYGLYKRESLTPAPYLFMRSRVSPLAAAAPSLTGLKLIAKAAADSQGVIEFKGVLMDVEYVVQQLSAPAGSLVSQNPVTLSFKEGPAGAPTLAAFSGGSGTAEVNGSGEIVWKAPQVSVGFARLDPQGALLAGATLQVVDESGAVVAGPWSSAQQEHLVTGVLEAGKTYRLQELAAPAGYARAADVAFTVENPAVGSNAGFVQHVTMASEKLPPADPEQPAKPETPSTKPEQLASTSGKGSSGSPQAAKALAATGDPLAPLAPALGAAALLSALAAGTALVRRRRRG